MFVSLGYNRLTSCDVDNDLNDGNFFEDSGFPVSTSL